MSASTSTGFAATPAIAVASMTEVKIPVAESVVLYGALASIADGIRRLPLAVTIESSVTLIPQLTARHVLTRLQGANKTV